MHDIKSNPDNKADVTGSGENRSVLPSLSFPKGGGAIRGIGEKFAANPVTGTGSLSVPIFTSPGRSGFGPQLSLSYDSGSGNGPFGFGWNLSLPSITRKTEKGLPRYQDANESDVFILSGAEDLGPVLVYHKDERKWKRGVPRTYGIFAIQRYRPRIEGLFARIERWTNKKTGVIHWRSISKDNITTTYGKTANSRIADPADPKRRIFSWLISESYDDRGNAIFYEYKREDTANVDTSRVQEKNRSPLSRSANRYLKRICYGNLTPHQPDEDLSQRRDWLFEVVFDYGEHNPAAPTTKDAGSWTVRQDAFSSYRAGFEVRSYRLCQRVLMFHHFPNELGTEDYLVRSTELTYKQSPIASFVTEIVQSGYVLRNDGTYLKRSLPPLEFEYSQATIHDEIEEIDAESLDNLPYGLDGALYQWVDLDGEGISGILTEQVGAWFYKPNLGGGVFGPLITVESKPSMAALSSGRQQLMDLAADGKLDLVELGGSVPGFYERTDDRSWDRFTSFKSLPYIAWTDPNMKFIDLTGDGHADILISEHEVFCWYPSLAEEGFGPSAKVRQSFDEEKGPRLIFADGTQSIYLSDMSGDGLTDLVRISNGEVCYWPNLGYGRFGDKVTMDNAPWFDAPDLFDQRRIRLADVDGTGVTDIIFLGRDGVSIYLNESGNSWSKAQTLSQFPPVDNISSVMVVDLLGKGTPCIVWSSPLPGHAGQQMSYIDLMGGEKPHLLLAMKNNLGAETRIRYASSTKFYLADREAGRPWITRLPFPVHVVERVEVYDRISRNRFVTRYAYHHGYFDGTEREFRGFGMVEKWDTEEIGDVPLDETTSEAVNLDQASYVPPVLTRTWFHTGAYLEGERISRQMADEYYGSPDWSDPDYEAAFRKFEATLLPDTVQPDSILLSDGTQLPWNLSTEEQRQACRAMKGSALRQEIYALDGRPESVHPYSVSERNFTIKVLQPQGQNRHSVFFTHPRETIDYHYERDPEDPRISHSLNLEVDCFGNVLKSAAIGYGRLQIDSDLTDIEREKQIQRLMVCTENSFTNRVEQDDVHRDPLPCETRTYELTDEPAGFRLSEDSRRFSFKEIMEICSNAETIAYDVMPSSGLQKRLIEHVRTLYRRDDLSGPLALGQLQSRALPYQSYKLAFTPGLIEQVYGERLTEAILSEGGKYVHSEGDSNWWIPSGQAFYSPSGDSPEEELEFAQAHFFLPHQFQDPFGKTARIEYDDYPLLGVRAIDPLDNVIAAENDYRVLQPRMVTDPNDNRAQAAFDALGMVVGTAVMGKEGEEKGDLLEGFEADLDEATILAHIEDPLNDPHEILGAASTRLVYDLFAYIRTKDDPKPQPAIVYTMAREMHHSDLEPRQMTAVQHSFSYSDGFGREVQKKIQAEPGPLEERGPEVDPRWVGSGWTIFNNKGSPVQKYEPFFSADHKFEFARAVGVSSTLFYDPLGRVVATLHPNHTYEKVIFDPWHQESWDVNDTVLVKDTMSPHDPREDPDVGDYFQRLPVEAYLPTWYDMRTDPEKAIIKWPDTDPVTGEAIPENARIRRAEREGADKVARQGGHLWTPSLAYLDTLGRTFLTVADNGDYGKYRTRVELDIEGNQREVIDAKGRVVMVYDYDMLGSRIRQQSMEAGARWVLNDVAGNPIYSWDSRSHRLRHVYDPLRRKTHLYLQEGEGLEELVERTVYGEGHSDSRPLEPGGAAAKRLNLRGRAYLQLDEAGVVVNSVQDSETGQEEAYDFKGNPLCGSRSFTRECKSRVDWSLVEPLLGTALLDPQEIKAALEPLLEAESFTSRTTYDALNRPMTMTKPDGSVIRPHYNEANLLESLEANLQDAAETTPFIIDIDYNAKGQRVLIEYGNSVKTHISYDEETFRLVNLLTLRAEERLQDLHYTYDPAGNIASIRDDSIQTIFYNGEVVRPDSEYSYDALYRLIAAKGREHIGQAPHPPWPTWHDRGRTNLVHPNDGQAMRNYFEFYEYDEVGNILKIDHDARDGGSWVRDYRYEEPSLTEPEKFSNRLSWTQVGGVLERYTYNEHGSMTSMAHLPVMAWDFKEQLKKADNGGEKAYYVYDAGGQRARKVIEQNGRC